MSIQLKSVAHNNDDGMVIIYTDKENNNDNKDITFTNKIESPHPDFLQALQALKYDLKRVIPYLSSVHDDAITIRSVSFKHDEVSGALKSTVLKPSIKITGLNSPWNPNTPSIPLRDEFKTESKKPKITFYSDPEGETRLIKLIDETMYYLVGGKRLAVQQKLDVDENGNK